MYIHAHVLKYMHTVFMGGIHIHTCQLLFTWFLPLFTVVLLSRTHRGNSILGNTIPALNATSSDALLPTQTTNSFDLPTHAEGGTSLK